MAYTAIRCVLPNNIPSNEGVFRAIEVIAPPGTITNCVLPAACAARGLTGFRMLDCCFGALAMMLPDRVCAASDGGNTGITIGGYHGDRSPFIYVDFTTGAWGGRPWADGLDGNTNLFINMASQSIEMTEAEHPVEILAYEFICDRAGPASFAVALPSAATTGSSRKRASCRCAPTVATSGPTASTAGNRGSRRATISIRTPRTGC